MKQQATEALMFLNNLIADVTLRMTAQGPMGLTEADRVNVRRHINTLCELVDSVDEKKGEGDA